MKFFYFLFKILFQVYILFVLTWYNPFSFLIFNSSVRISLDLLMLYFLIQSHFLSRSGLVFLGCFLGYLLDLDLENSLVGINCFFMSIAGYFLGLVKINSSNWGDVIKYGYIYLICLIVSINKYLFYNYQISFSDFISVIINSLIIMITLMIVNRFYYKGKLI